MLEKIGKGILKYKGIVLLVMAILFAVTVVGTVYLVLDENKINSDMVSYLDEDSKTKQSLVFLKDEFGIRGNATLVVRVNEADPDEYARFEQAVQNVKSIEKVSSITWYGALASYEQFDTGLSEIISLLNENRATLNRIGNTLLNEEDFQDKKDDLTKALALLALADYYNIDFIDTSSMKNYLRQPTSEEGVYDYVVLVLTNIDSEEDTTALLDSITSEFEYTNYASTGTAETSRRLLRDTMEDLPWFIVIGVLSVLIILLLCSASFVEPFILLSTLLVGIVISMGINYLFPSISIISFAISAVLQLAITMDYAIFYMHVYRKKRAQYSVDVATAKAFPEVAESVLASGFTTVGGFVALYCMQFKIGTDIANVLVKGVILSMITVLLLQPILTFLLDGIIGKTTHHFTEKFTSAVNAKREKKGKKALSFERSTFFRPVAKFAVWQRIVLIVLALALIVPCFLAQRNVEFSYLELYEKDNSTEEDRLANELGNQLILAVPLKTTKKDKTQQDFIQEIRSINPDRITGMMGVFTAVKIKEELLETLLDISQSANTSNLNTYERLFSGDYLEAFANYGISEEDFEVLKEFVSILSKFRDQDGTDSVDFSALNSYFRKVDGKWYTLYTISFSGNTEDDEAQQAYEKILDKGSEYFGANNVYPVGLITSSHEMSSITPHDFLIVTLVSIAIIYAIVTLLLRNPLKSLFIIIIIELGIWINLAFNFLFKESINFIVYVIISSVQLGCTVDYAILYANTFEKNREKFESGKECAKATTAETIPAIFTSALMIGSVCMGMYLISSNLIIKQLTGMLARGALISLLLVVFVQTAVWSFFKTERKQYHFEDKLKALEESESHPDAVQNPDSGKTKKKKLSPQEKLALLEQQEKK